MPRDVAWPRAFCPFSSVDETVSRTVAGGSVGPHSSSLWPGAELKLSGTQKRTRAPSLMPDQQQKYITDHTHTHTHEYKQRHVPDRSSDLFLFWGSLGFFTGGLRFWGFSTLLGLSLSVPEHSKDKQVSYRRSSTWIHKPRGPSGAYLRRRTWPFGFSAASPAPEVWALPLLKRSKDGRG